MNVFERIEAMRLLRQSSIVPMWVSFQSAVAALVESYNQIQQGKAYPAVLQSNDTSILINSGRGMASDQYRSVSISVRLTLLKDRYTILATAAEWLTSLEGNVQKQEDFISIEFVLDGDPENGTSWLSWNGEHLSASQAAERILYPALLPRSGGG